MKIARVLNRLLVFGTKIFSVLHKSDLSELQIQIDLSFVGITELSAG